MTPLRVLRVRCDAMVVVGLGRADEKNPTTRQIITQRTEGYMARAEQIKKMLDAKAKSPKQPVAAEGGKEAKDENSELMKKLRSAESAPCVCTCVCLRSVPLVARSPMVQLRPSAPPRLPGPPPPRHCSRAVAQLGRVFHRAALVVICP